MKSQHIDHQDRIGYRQLVTRGEECIFAESRCHPTEDAQLLLMHAHQAPHASLGTLSLQIQADC